MLTKEQKLAALHSAEDAVKKAYADLFDLSTGYAVTADGPPLIDGKTGRVFSVVNGKRQSVRGDYVPETAPQ